MLYWTNYPTLGLTGVDMIYVLKRMGWTGNSVNTRTLWLDKNGKQLMQLPIEKLAALRTDEVRCTNENLTTGRRLFEVQGITTATADIEVTFRIPSVENAELFDPSWVDTQQLCGEKGANVNGGIVPFGLFTLASDDLEEYTTVFFRVFRAQDKYVVLMGSGGSRSLSYGAFVDVDLIDGEISLRCLLQISIFFKVVCNIDQSLQAYMLLPTLYSLITKPKPTRPVISISTHDEPGFIFVKYILGLYEIYIGE